MIRLACDGSSVISDLSVLRGVVNASGAHRLFYPAFLQVLDSSSERQRRTSTFILHFCKFLILLMNPFLDLSDCMALDSNGRNCP
ncbi:TPA: hypothetical protein NV912_004494 [Escherichia coli]|nr:hypothetical protein [Escherichia coli]